MTATFEIIAFTVAAFIAIAGALGMTTTMSMFRSGIFLMASFIGVAGLFILLAADLIGVLQIMMYIGGFLVMILFMVMVMHDPGGSMMAGTDMAPLERWFSKGLVPLKPTKGHGHGGHERGAMPDDSDGHAAHQEHEAQATHRDQMHSGHKTHGTHDDEHAGHEHDAMQYIDHGDHEGAALHHQAHGAHEPGGMVMGDMDMSMVTPVRPVAAWLAIAVGIVLVGMLLLRPAWRIVEAFPDPDSARRVGHLLMAKYMVAFEGAGFLILIGIFGAVLLARPSSYPDDPSRSAKVAIDQKPEPIADDGLVTLAGAGSHPEHDDYRRPPEHRA